MSYHCKLEINFEGWNSPHVLTSPAYSQLVSDMIDIAENPPAPIAGPPFLSVHFSSLISPVYFKWTGDGTFWRCSRLTIDHFRALNAHGIPQEITLNNYLGVARD